MDISVIGSGIGGLSSAIRLANKGYNVTVYEKNSKPGGKLGTLTLDDYKFDTGPSLLTMPHLIDELFELSHVNPRKYFNYKKKNVHCKYFWDDRKTFTAYSKQSKYLAEAKNSLGVTENNLKRYFDKAAKKYDLINKIFLKNSIHKLSTYFNYETFKASINLFTFQLFSSLYDVNRKEIQNDRMEQILNRYATYNGSSPYKTSGIMTIIQHLENYHGTFVCDGGMNQIPKALYDLCIKIGIKFEFNTDVKKILFENNKIEGIQTSKNLIKTDIVISNSDINYTYKNLLGDKKFSIKQNDMSSSAVIFFWGIKKEYKNLDLHNIFFSSNYKKEFEEIFENNNISNDPTVYVNITSKDIKNVSPKKSENWFVMINSPKDIGQNWDNIKMTLRRNVINKLNNILETDIEKFISVEKIYTPKDIEKNSRSYLGSLYGSSSNSIFSPIMRHPNFSTRIKNLFFCGGTVHPGGGIPLCIMSSKIVSELIEKSN